MRIWIVKFVDKLLGRFLARVLPHVPKHEFLDGVRSVLIIRPGGIGDACLLMPAINLLVKKLPGLRVEVLAEKRNSQAFQMCKSVAHVWCYDRLRDFFLLTTRRYDVIIDTEQWYRLSAVFARGITTQMRIGFATNERRRLFNYPVDYEAHEYEPWSFFRLLGPLGICAEEPLPEIFLTIPDRVKMKVEATFGLPQKGYVVIFPGSSVEEKRWGTDRFRRLAELIVAEGFAVVVIGGKEDIDTGGKIVDGGLGLSLAGKVSLIESAAVVNNSRLLVAGDSGVLHMGLGLGKPTVSIFGPSNTEKWAPRGHKHIVIHRKLSCCPCAAFGIIPPCPIGAKCIQDISSDDVFTGVKKMLKITRGESGS